MLYWEQSQAQGPGPQVAWRSEQADAVVGSGPLVAGRCPRLADRALCADYHLGEAVGHPAAFRFLNHGLQITRIHLHCAQAQVIRIFMWLDPGGLGGGLGACAALKAQLASAGVVHAAQGDAVAGVEWLALARTQSLAVDERAVGAVVVV
jgi:hypothetical protein